MNIELRKVLACQRLRTDFDDAISPPQPRRGCLPSLFPNQIPIFSIPKYTQRVDGGVLICAAIRRPIMQNNSPPIEDALQEELHNLAFGGFGGLGACCL